MKKKNIFINFLIKFDERFGIGLNNRLAKKFGIPKKAFNSLVSLTCLILLILIAYILINSWWLA